MELAQRAAEDAVLEPGEDPVADELVEGHPAPQGRTRRQHARAEHGVGLALEERLDEVGQALRRVLPVAVDERHEVEAPLDRVVVADLLVAAVALVQRVEEHVQLQRQGAVALELAAALERPILRESSITRTSTSQASVSRRGIRRSTCAIVRSAL